MDVHETRRDGLACGIDLVRGLAVDLAHGHDPVAADAEIGRASGGAGSVDDGAVADDQVVTHLRLSCGAGAALA